MYHVEAAGQQVAQKFGDMVSLDEVVKIKEGFELLVASWRAGDLTVELYAPQKVVAV